MDKTTAISVFEKLDEQQIVNADKAVKQAMVYETKINGETKQEITFIGLKHIMLELSARGHPLEIIQSETKLEKDDPEDKTTWNWRSKVVCKNSNTGHQSEGLAESPYIEYGKYDPFGQRKAHSKAERNAWRKQIPELQIIEFLKTVKKEDVQKVNEQQNTCRCTPIELGPDEKHCVNGHNLTDAQVKFAKYQQAQK